MADLVNRLGFEPADAKMLYDAETVDELMLLGDRFENEWQRLAALGMAAGDTVEAIRVDLGFTESEEAASGSETPTTTAAERQETAVTAVAESSAKPPSSDFVQPEPEQTASDAALAASLALPASRMQFTLVTDDEELKQILELGDFGAWRTFLHPEQRRYVERNYNGPFRLTGGAGTGKTVVLLHRTRRLSNAEPGTRIILTTFTKALAGMLERDLQRLDETIPLAGALGEGGVFVRGVDALATAVRARANMAEWEELGRSLLGRSIARCSIVANSHGWDAAASAVASTLGEIASPSFLEAEYLQVVLPNHVTMLAEYLAVKRPGRRVAMNRAQRSAVWSAVERYRTALGQAHEIAWAELSALAGRYLLDHPDATPADHVLVDEGQDLSPLHWQLLRALVAPGQNDLFIAEDIHQRIYGHRIILSRYGIATVGRSRRLTLNYRTTWENLRYALGILEGADFVDANDDIEHTGGYRSARRGPVPELMECPNATEQANAIATLIKKWQREGNNQAIAVLGRTHPALRRLHRQLEQRGVKTEHYSENADLSVPQLVTMHSAKGLEFSRVVLYDISDGSIPLLTAVAGLEGAERDDALLRERSLLYVAATRARDELVLTWSGTLSELVR